MSEFHQRNFASRWGQMGDKAETAFVELCPNAHRLGLDRTNLQVSKMHLNSRYAPDFLIEEGAVEVMGFASRGNNVIKLKCEKVQALLAWGLLMPTHLWVRDSSTGKVWYAPIEDWARACYQHAERKFFDDNQRPYWELAPPLFPVAPYAIKVAA